jgi:hypothetical protein
MDTILAKWDTKWDTILTRWDIKWDTILPKWDTKGHQRTSKMVSHLVMVKSWDSGEISRRFSGLRG